MQSKMIFCPWAVAASFGRPGYGILLFVMQLTLVLWPTAVSAAKRLEQDQQTQVLLDQLAEYYALPPGNASILAGAGAASVKSFASPAQ